MITDEIKKQIREEEIYRIEVKKEFESARNNKLITFLNSALGLWLLSTLFVGLLSFGYTQWKETQISNEKQQQTLQKITEEGQFRVSQLNASMNKAFLSMGLTLSELKKNKGKASGKLISDFFENASLLSVAIQLGGVTHLPPLDNERTIQIGNAGYSSRHLPFSQGYKFPEYKFLSLFDLSKRFFKIKNGNVMPQSKINSIKSDLDELLFISDLSIHNKIFKKWKIKTQQYDLDLYQIEISEFVPQIMEISGWLSEIKEHLDNNVRLKDEISVFDSI